MLASARALIDRVRAGRVGRLAARHGFAVRLVFTLLVTMAVVLAANQLFFERAATGQLLEEGERRYAAAATSAANVAREVRSDDAMAAEVGEFVAALQGLPAVTAVRVVDRRGRVVASGDPAEMGGVRRTPEIAEALVQGGPASRAVDRDGGDPERLHYAAPLRVDGEPYALEVEEDAAPLNAKVDTLRGETLAFSAIALLVGLAVFYGLGGRSLLRRHDRVLERATRDPLTGLGNHRAFQEELDRAVASAARRGAPLALAMLDLDDFKAVNDRHGHRRGDAALVDIADVHGRVGRPDDRAFRVGGDEFALLMPGTGAEAARTAVLRRLEEMRRRSGTISFTAGIAVAQPGGEADPGVLWEQADAALYEGKRTGRGTIAIFDEVSALKSVVTPAKVHALRSLLDAPRVAIAFQPICQLDDGRVLGYEALARPSDGYGFDGPSETFAIAETLGRAHELDAVYRRAALDRASALPEGVRLFLNVHPSSIDRGTLSGDRLVGAVEDAGLAPDRVVLEITERAVGHVDQMVASVARLRALGFALALDDVGAGNAGLEMLRRMPVDYVKIDPWVVAQAAEDPRARGVLAAIVAYSRLTRSYIIAEGIETREMLDLVEHAHEFDAAIGGGQGYLLGKPSTDLPPRAEPLDVDALRGQRVH